MRIVTFLFLSAVGLTFELFCPMAAQEPDLYYAEIMSLQRIILDNQVTFTVTYCTHHEITLHWLLYHGRVVKERKSSDTITISENGTITANFTTSTTSRQDAFILLKFLEGNYKSKGYYLSLDINNADLGNQDDTVYLPHISVTSNITHYGDLQVSVPVVPGSTLTSNITGIAFFSAHIDAMDTSLIYHYSIPDSFTLIAQAHTGQTFERTIHLNSVYSTVRMISMFLTFPEPASSFITKIKWWQLLTNPNKRDFLPDGFLGFVYLDTMQRDHGNVHQTCRTDEMCTLICLAAGSNIDYFELLKIESDGSTTPMNTSKVFGDVVKDLVFAIPGPYNVQHETYKCVVKNEQEQTKELLYNITYISD